MFVEPETSGIVVTYYLLKNNPQYKIKSFSRDKDFKYIKWDKKSIEMTIMSVQNWLDRMMYYKQKYKVSNLYIITKFNNLGDYKFGDEYFELIFSTRNNKIYRYNNGNK